MTVCENEGTFERKLPLVSTLALELPRLTAVKHA
jgi:hypothetical protein